MKASAIGKIFQMHRLCGSWKIGINGEGTETKLSSDCCFRTSGFPVELLVSVGGKTKKTKQNISELQMTRRSPFRKQVNATVLSVSSFLSQKEWVMFKSE